MSKTDNNDCTTSKTNLCEKVVMAVTMTHMHHNSISDTVPVPISCEVVLTTLASESHSQSDGSTKRANRTITQALHQCLRPPANQPETDWMSRIMISLIRASVSSTAMDYPSVCEFALQKKLVLRSVHIMAAHTELKQTSAKLGER